MSDEEKKAIEDLKGIDITYFVNGHECANFYLDEADKVSKEIELILNLIEKQQKELNSLKEIEQSHQEENGKLRVELEQVERKVEEYRIGWCNTGEELEQEKERNNELEIELSIRDNINVDKLVEKYRYYRRLAASYQANCISKDKLKELLENEIIDISGFRCIAVEDIENLLEEK